MSSLREIKDRIGSVRSTLKITSAMKLVSSAKLRKAQKAIEGLRPYETALAGILNSLLAGGNFHDGTMENSACRNVAVVAVSSNSSLCGSFNTNVIRKTLETVRQYEAEGCVVSVFAIGRKMSEAMRKAGYQTHEDYSALVGHPSYDLSAKLASDISGKFEEGAYSRVILVYNHFVSSARQTVMVEPYLPFTMEGKADADVPDPSEKYIIEPGAEEVIKALVPQVLMLKFHAAILDSQAAEQAARTIAMQTASDNAEDLLSELTLEYNKGRQQKITAEILDLLGGATQ